MRKLVYGLIACCLFSSSAVAEIKCCESCRCVGKGFSNCDCGQGDACRCIILPTVFNDDSPPTKECQAEAILTDGSKLRVKIPASNIELETKFGKLLVPINEIGRIEFGMHYPEGVKTKITTSIKNLGSTDYKERAAAERELLHFGEMSYPMLNVLKSENMEVQKRSGKILNQLRERYSQDRLTRNLDTIHTQTSKITGTIINSEIKTVSQSLGDISLKLYCLQSLTVFSSAQDVEIELDAAKYTGSEEWLDTQMFIDVRMQLSITCSGQIDLWPQIPGQYLVTPKGYSSNGKGGLFPAGIVIGKIGPKGKSFIVGESYTGMPEGTGTLHLAIVASPWNNLSSGTYRVRYKLEPK